MIINSNRFMFAMACVFAALDATVGAVRSDSWFWRIVSVLAAVIWVHQTVVALTKKEL